MSFPYVKICFMYCKKILMIFSLSNALLPKPVLCLAKRSGYPGSWLGTNSRFGRDPKRFNAFRRKPNDFFAKIFFLTLAFTSSRDRNDQWLINHNGRRYQGCALEPKTTERATFDREADHKNVSRCSGRDLPPKSGHSTSKLMNIPKIWRVGKGGYGTCP